MNQFLEITALKSCGIFLRNCVRNKTIDEDKQEQMVGANVKLIWVSMKLSCVQQHQWSSVNLR